MKEVSPPNTGEIYFTSIKLYIAVSRSILSRDLLNFDLLFDTMPNFLRYRAFINSGNINFKLNKTSFGALRDFSQKAILGELAQGVTMLFAQEHLGYPIFVDFQGFIKNKNHTAHLVAVTEMPDYIIQKNSDFNISIVESKGHYAVNNTTKGKLAKGLRQCRNGVTIVNSALPNYAIQKSYCVCLKLRDETSASQSEIQFVDPDEHALKGNSNIEVMQYHYASWFLLMGNLQLYDRLINNEIITLTDLERSYSQEHLGKSFIFFNDRGFGFENHFPIDFLKPAHSWQYGILKEVMDILMGKASKLSEINFKTEVLEGKSKGITYFHDGTIFIHSQTPWWE